MQSTIERETNLELMGLIDRSPSAYHAVSTIAEMLETAGFHHYEASEIRELAPGTKGYYTKNASALAAFVIGKTTLTPAFRLMGAHTDSPSLKIKPSALIKSEGILKLNTEVYGGPILNTWFDRPLSLAGRVAVRSGKALSPTISLIDFQEPLLILPNVAIHMNRDVNNGVKIERQKVLLPILAQPAASTDGEPTDSTDYFTRLVADKLGVAPADILDYDLYTYETQAASFVGANEEFISAARLDNLASCHAGIRALIDAGVPDEGINVVYLSDHEEVGSGSKQGAHSTLLRDLLELLVSAVGGSRQDFLSSFDRSFMISVDLAHAVHPNYAEYSDVNNRPAINGGPVIKTAAGQSYTSDADSTAAFLAICEEAGVPCQRFVNRSDLRGGSTIGPISSQMVPVRSVDIGTAIWGMHSVRETAGSKDQLYMLKALTAYFQSLI